MAKAGDAIEMTVNHNTLGTRTFFVKSGEDHENDLGGYRSEDDDNLVDGGGEIIDIMKQVRWSQALVLSHDENVRKDLVFMVALAESPDTASYTFSFINGTVKQGIGKPVGDLKGAGSAGTIAVKIAGGGKLKDVN